MDLIEARKRSIEDFAQEVSDIAHSHSYDKSVCTLVDVVRQEVYAYYPFLFAEAFVERPSAGDLEVLQKLNTASCLYYMHLILSDRVIDNDLYNDRAELVLLSNHLQRKALHLLCTLFPRDSRFWNIFSDYHEQFTTAILEEHRRHSGTYQPFSQDDLVRIAAGKCAIAKTATAALTILFKKPEFLEPFSLSQDCFHVAFQLADDVKDWRRDYGAKQYSFVLSKVIQAHNLRAELDCASKPETELIGKMMFFSGIAEYALELSLAYYEKAFAAVNNITCQQWKNVIQSNIDSVMKDKWLLHGTRKAGLSKHTVPPLATHDKTHRVGDSRAVEMALSHASEFLVAGFERERHWSDFLTNVGESTDWVTGYVGYCISKHGPADPVLTKAVNAIKQDRFPHGGWGYSRWVCVDADSTAACLRFLHNAGIEKENLLKDLNALCQHQKSDGGFSTYASPTEIRHVIKASQDNQLEGWCSSHLCVTAAALQVLLELGQTVEGREVRSAIDFILSRQHPEGYWESYWWDGRIYGTANSIMALIQADKTHFIEPIEKAIHWLLDVQQQDGGWNNGIESESKPFHTGLALQALIDFDAGALHVPIEKGMQWLLSNQLTDGTWMSYPILRVPEPDCLRPWEKTDWRRSPVGTGILVEDHNRLFTTGTVLAALAAYQRFVYHTSSTTT